MKGLLCSTRNMHIDTDRAYSCFDTLNKCLHNPLGGLIKKHNHRHVIGVLNGGCPCPMAIDPPDWAIERNVEGRPLRVFEKAVNEKERPNVDDDDTRARFPQLLVNWSCCTPYTGSGLHFWLFRIN